jgi:hypothetical protein
MLPYMVFVSDVVAVCAAVVGMSACVQLTGWTALMSACPHDRWHLPVVMSLLDAGASVHMTTVRAHKEQLLM